MIWNAKWIKPSSDIGTIAPIFSKKIILAEKAEKAILSITAIGVYEASINNERIGKFILAPGWTSYKKRLQYQTYDVTDFLQNPENILTVLVGNGWYRSRLPEWANSSVQKELQMQPPAILAQLDILYKSGRTESICSDETWLWTESNIVFSELYDGEICDATYVPNYTQNAVCFAGPSHTLIEQEGPEIIEQERISAAELFTTPKGELIIDFGQNMTGYIESTLFGKSGDVLDISFAEVLDKDGNFYTDNYRTAKAQYRYICYEGKQVYKPKLTFWGFRYIRINEFPGGFDKVNLETFVAIVLHSDMKRTGYLSCSNANLNQLFSNIIWGQKGNFVDVPTDCPQRDERFGWTGDAQVFIKTACLNYDVEKFFSKWLADLRSDQREDGYVGIIVPDLIPRKTSSAAWGDAATICPWTLYMEYGNKEILGKQFHSMQKWVDYITSITTTPYLWTGGTEHYGDWLGLDAPSGSYKGSSNEDLIASAFYAYSTSLVVKAGKVLNKDISIYEQLYENIVAAFRHYYPIYKTQTECVLAVHFGLAENCQKVVDQLAKMVIDCGIHLETGFVGTPYLLHVLSSYGYVELAYSLLLREEYPSWLYSVKKGATTIWEHWDGIKEDGTFWSADMNSYNHYAYGAVADWVYSVAAGIKPMEEMPGYGKIYIKPNPDKRLKWLNASVETRQGVVSSGWKQEDSNWRYEISTPTDTIVVIADKEYYVTAGTYCFYSRIE